MTILDRLAEHARERVAADKNNLSLKSIQAQA